MRIVITGGCGFLGRRVASALLERRAMIDELVLFDNAPPALPLPEDKRSRSSPATSPTARRCARADRARHRRGVPSRRHRQRRGRGRHRSRLPRQPRRHARSARRLPRARHLPAAGLRQLARGLWRRLPPDVGDDTALTPQTSYGTQKAIGELLVNDYSRKGFVDGRALRLPTVVVRPGPAEPRRLDLRLLDHPRAARGQARRFARCRPIRSWRWPRRGASSPACVHALDLPADAFGVNRSLQLPGFSVSVGEMVEAVRRAGGEAAHARIRWQPDPANPADRLRLAAGASAPRAPRRLGFTADSGIDEVVRAFIEDDLEMQKALAR